MAGGGGGQVPSSMLVGKVTCGAWIRRRDGGAAASRLLVLYGRAAAASSPPLLDLLAFDASKSALASEEPLVSRPRPPLSSSIGGFGACALLFCYYGR